jgi:hypothetical protein
MNKRKMPKINNVAAVEIIHNRTSGSISIPKNDAARNPIPNTTGRYFSN